MAWTDSFETRTLEMFNVMSTQMISRMQAEHGIGGRFKAHAFLPATMDALVFQLVGYLAADHVDSVTIAYPRDWWEAVKQRFAPSWFTKRYPVVETRHVVDLKAVYPKIPLPEKFGPYIRVVQHKTERSDWMEES